MDGAPVVGPVPGLARRMACFVYEGVLLFGVLTISGYLYSSLSQQRNAMSGRLGLQVFLFVVLGIYFTWFWSHGGQTVAMKAWNIRLVDRAGAPVGQARAFVRYLASWLWFVPALVSLYLAGVHTLPAIFGVLLAGLVAYAALARLHPEGQFWHDHLCGTQLVGVAPAAKT